MKCVILESPFAGRGGTDAEKAEDHAANVEYARQALRYCALRKESALASHLLWPQCLDDSIPDERRLGIDLGLAWGREAHATVVYADRGISSGMEYGILRAFKEDRAVIVRSLGTPGEGWYSAVEKQIDAIRDANAADITMALAARNCYGGFGAHAFDTILGAVNCKLVNYYMNAKDGYALVSFNVPRGDVVDSNLERGFRVEVQHAGADFRTVEAALAQAAADYMLAWHKSGRP